MPWENLAADLEAEFESLTPRDTWATGQTVVASRKALWAREWRKFNRGKVLADTRRKNRLRFERTRVSKICRGCGIWFSPFRISGVFCTHSCQKTFNNKNREYVDGKRVVKKYTVDPVPGEFDHRGGDCLVHGENIAVFRQKGFLGEFSCVACALVLEKEQEMPT